MIRDPERRGRELAKLYATLAPRLFEDLAAAELLDSAAPARARAWREWECFALYACVRGLVAAGGFNRETAAAIDALHEAALDAWVADARGGETLDERRRLISDRYAEYGAIGQAGGASGAATVAERLGLAAARHMSGVDDPPAVLSEAVGTLHEELVLGATTSVNQAA